MSDTNQSELETILQRLRGNSLSWDHREHAVALLHAEYTRLRAALAAANARIAELEKSSPEQETSSGALHPSQTSGV